MAGVGFKLRKMVSWDSYASLFRAYGYSAMIGAGAWVIATVAILATVLLVNSENVNKPYVREFLATVTFLIVTSLILTSFVQHSYTRYISDRLFEKDIGQVLPSLISICLFVTVSYGAVLYFTVDFLFPQQSYLYRLFFSANFVLLVNIWPCSNLLVGLKKYTELFYAYFLGYGTLIVMSMFLKPSKLVGLMFAFFLAQFMVYATILFFIVKSFFAERFVHFDYFSRKRTYVALVLTSFFFNMGVWVDKFIFWYYPNTSHAVIGIIRASTIYDLPMFISFFLMIPAFSFFVFRMEADFSIYYDYYYQAVRDGGTLREILEKRDVLVSKSTESIMDILKVQALVFLFVYLFGDKVLTLVHLPLLHFYLLRIDLLSATFFLILGALMNILFYLDRRKEALILSIVLFASNTIFTLISLYLGSFYYGYGFCVALFLSCVGAIYYLNRDLSRLEFRTFMR